MTARNRFWDAYDFMSGYYGLLNVLQEKGIKYAELFQNPRLYQWKKEIDEMEHQVDENFRELQKNGEKTDWTALLGEVGYTLRHPLKFYRGFFYDSGPKIR